MVVTRQGTVTSPAAPQGASPAAPGAAADATAGAPKGRSPLKAAAQQRAPSRKKRVGGPSPAAAKAAAAHRSERNFASPAASPRAAAAAAVASPRVHIASKAEVLPATSAAAVGRRAAAERPLYKGGPLKERLQTGPLPFVRQMSGMSDSEEKETENADEGFAAAARLTPTTRRRRGGAAAAAAELTRQSSSSSSSNGSVSNRQARAQGSGADQQMEAAEEALALGGIRSRSSNINRSSSSSSSSGSSGRLSEGKLGQLLLTYFCYASLYLTRKPFASCKRELEVQLGFSTAALGGVDSVFLSAYAASQLLLAPALLGAGGGRCCSSRILAAAYCVSACCCLLISLLPDASLSLMLLSLLWGLNGAAQALAFPLLVSSLSSWLSNTERGGVLGVWTTCQQVGSIFASYLTAELLSGAAEGPSALLSNISLWGPHTKGLSRWRQTFFVSALWVFCCSVLLLRCLRSAPQDPEAAAAAKQQQQNQKQQPKQQQQQQQQQQHNSLLVRVIGIGRFRRLCGAYFCVKLVRYALLYWLAYYLEQHGGLSAAAAAFYCTYFDAGGVFGSVSVGWLSDKYLRGRRSLLLAPMCWLAGAFLVLLHSSLLWGPTGDLGFAAQFALLLAGAAIAAPDSALGAAAAADACAEEKETQNETFAAAASCIVNGAGSVGSILQGLLTPTLLSAYGWSCVFNYLALMSVLGGVSLLPSALKDIEFLRAAKAQ